MKALVIANGNIDVNVDNYIDERFIVAVDGGLNKIESCKVHLLIGDMDSVDKEKLNSFKGEKIVFKKEKDYTDLFLAIKEVVGRGYNDIIILGAIGSRIDHSLTSLFSLLKFKADIKIIDKNNIIFIKKESFTLKKDNDYYFSLIPLTDIIDLKIINAKYPLEGININFGDTLLQSNEFLNDDVLIEFKEGILFVIKSRD